MYDNKKKIQKENNCRGFTLVEVMIAVAILAIGILGIAAMQVQAIRSTDYARRSTEALNIASERMEVLNALDIDNPLFNDNNADGAAGLDRPSRIQVINAGNVLLNVADNQMLVRNDSMGGGCFLYWNVDPGANVFVNSPSRTISVIVAWNERGVMHRHRFNYIKHR